MGFLSFRNNKEKIVAIFDIGSGSVAGSIVSLDKENKRIPIILNSVRNEIRFREDGNFGLFFKDMTDTLKKTVVDLYNLKAGIPSEIFCTLSSPWYVSENRIIKMSKEHSFLFTNKILNELVEKEINVVRDDYKRRYNDYEPEVFEHEVINILLNGYDLNNPFDKKSRSVEINLITSISLKKYLDEIKNILNNTYHHLPISFNSFIVNSYIAVRNKYISPDSYLLVDVGGEVTDLGVVYKGSLKIIISFPFGKKRFYKIISEKLNIENRDSIELVSLFTKGTISDEQKEKLMIGIKEAEKVWGDLFCNSIKVLPTTFNLPENIFLTIDNDIKKWFVDMVANESYLKSLVSPSKCNVVSLEGPSFLNMCMNKAGDCDPFLMIEAIALSRKLENRK